MRLARDVVVAKVRNQRTLLRRNWKRGELPERLLSEFKQDIDAAERAHSLEQLLGVEGNAAARYFRHFGEMISVRNGDAANAGSNASDNEGKKESTGTVQVWPFDFERRTRRPPTDRTASTHCCRMPMPCSRAAWPSR